MPNIAVVALASSAAIIPTTVGAIYLASPSIFQTSKESELPKEQIERQETPEERAKFLTTTRNKFSKVKEEFPFENIRKNEDFVVETDKVREGFKNTISRLLKNKENKDWKEILTSDLKLSLIEESDNSSWNKLINIRKNETYGQTSYAISKGSVLARTEGMSVGKDNIVKFCKDPSVQNIKLGMRSDARKGLDEADEYRFFTYYSYCSKESYYLSDKVKLSSY